MFMCHIGSTAALQAENPRPCELGNFRRIRTSGPPGKNERICVILEEINVYVPYRGRNQRTGAISKRICAISSRKKSTYVCHIGLKEKRQRPSRKRPTPGFLIPLSPTLIQDMRLPGKGNSNSHGARPVHLIITMIKWIRTSRLSIHNSLSKAVRGGTRSEDAASSKAFESSRSGPPGRNQHPVSSPPSALHSYKTYRGTSLIRKRPPLVPYSRNTSRALW